MDFWYKKSLLATTNKSHKKKNHNSCSNCPEQFFIIDHAITIDHHTYIAITIDTTYITLNTAGL